MFKCAVVLFIVFSNFEESISRSDFNSDHLECFLNTRRQLHDGCNLDRNCKFKAHSDRGEHCWGYEDECPRERSYGLSECERFDRESATEFHQRQEDHFRQADFGYILQRAQSMFPLCTPVHGTKHGVVASSINCSANLEFCRGRQVALDLRELKDRDELLRYSMDVLRPGQISANCRVDEERLDSELQFMSPLQSWAPEMRNLRQTSRLTCDVTINTPTYIMKLDAAVSMFHHFCDFFNLYASQHLNETGNSGYPHSFDRDKQIVIWENIPYRSAFAPMFKVFTNRPLLDLSQLAGKRVCFADVVFPLLPRMIFGLFYNTPQIDGCRGSGLFRAFREHTLHRLSVPQRTEVPHDTVHVLWISRQTRHRRVLNEDQLLTALNSVSSLSVERADFTHATPFERQVRVVSAADVLVAMHGSGLTHMLLLPAWAAVYELYHCGDPHCYSSLAHMCRLMYVTSERTDGIVIAQNKGEHPQLGAHEKFTNYTLDVSEVVRVVQMAARHVRHHEAFIAARRRHQNRQQQQQQHEEL